MPRTHRRPFAHRGLGHLTGLLVVIGAAGGALPAAGQEKPYPIFTAEHFGPAMKTVGQAFAAVSASLGRNEFEDSKAYLVISCGRLHIPLTFVRGRDKRVAIRI